MLRRLLAFLVLFTMLTALFGACGSRDPHGAEEETELTERTGDFRNIVVGYDAGRAVNCAVYSASLSGSEISGIVFDGVEYRAEMESRCMNNLGAGNVMDVTFRNVTANGEKISPANLGRKVLTDSPGLCRAE